MIVDSSAVIAIVFDEVDAGRYAQALEDADDVSISAPTFVETCVVAGPSRWHLVDDLVSMMDVITFSHRDALVARAAYARYGKGSGSRARLNLGDCFSYALATTTGESLLFKGDDFTHTDVVPALPST